VKVRRVERKVVLHPLLVVPADMAKVALIFAVRGKDKRTVSVKPARIRGVLDIICNYLWCSLHVLCFHILSNAKGDYKLLQSRRCGLAS
jgi:hypothetical protein